MNALLSRTSQTPLWITPSPARSLREHVIVVGASSEISSRLLNLIPPAETNPEAPPYRQFADRLLAALVEGLQATEGGTVAQRKVSRPRGYRGMVLR